MEIKKFVVGPLGTNSYLIKTEPINLLIDPGSTPQETKELFNNSDTVIHKVLLTHAHIDHILGIATLKKIFPELTVHLNIDDKELYEKAELQASLFGLPYEPLESPEYFSNDTTEIAGFKIVRTPGHSPGGVCFYNKENSVLFAGDTIFRFSVGRTDLWGGSWEKLVTSIKERLFTLPPETVVYCGHGEETTIGEEQKGNPFLN